MKEDKEELWKKFIKVLKKTVAIGTGVAMLGATLAGALA